MNSTSSRWEENSTVELQTNFELHTEKYTIEKSKSKISNTHEEPSWNHQQEPKLCELKRVARIEHTSMIWLQLLMIFSVPEVEDESDESEGSVGK